MVEHQLLDDPTVATNKENPELRQDLALWGIVLWQPTSRIRIRARARYLDEAVGKDTKLETSLSTIIDAAFKLRKRDTLRVRMDNKWYLDDRESTIARTPGGGDTIVGPFREPEVQLWLSYEARL
jgi:hypothetical protein